MNSVATRLIKDYGRLNDSNICISCRVFEPSSSSNAKHRATVVEWINDTLPHLSLPINASDEELRAFLVDGSVLCQLLNKLEPDLVTEDCGSSHSWESCSENVGRFLSAMDKMGLPRFHPSDLEYGSMKIVVDCLLTLQTHFMPNVGAYKNLNTHTSNLSGNASNIRWKEPGEHFGCGDATQRQESSRSHSSLSSREERQNSDSKFKRTLRTPVMADPSAALVHQVGHRFQEVFQVKQGSYADLLPAKVSEVMKSNSLDNAPTCSLLSVVNGILDESTERKNGGVPERVACLLRKVVQEIEMRISTQAEHLRMQSDLFKAREEKYQSRIRDLEALAAGTREETEIVMNPLRHIKNEKNKIQEKTKSAEQEIAVLKQEPEAAPVAYELHCWQMRADEHDVVSLMKEKDDANQKIAILEQELEAFRKTYEQHCSQIKINEDDMARLMKEKDDASKMIAILKLELETARETYEQQCSQMKTDEHSVVRLMKEKDDANREIAVLKQELEAARKTSEQHNSQMNTDEDDLVRLMKEKNDANQEIAVLKKELEAVQKSYEQQCLLIKTEEHDVARLMKEKNDAIQEIAVQKKELEAVQKLYEQQCLLMKTEEHDVAKLMKEKDDANQEIAVLKQEFEETKKTYEQNCLQMKTETIEVQRDLEERLKEITSLEERLKEVTNHFTESRNRVKELEEFSEAKSQQWSKIQHIYQIFTEFQLGALRELRFSSQSIRQEVAKTQKIYSEEFNHLGVKIRSLEDAAANYSVILAENRKLHNEVQELKGNIRVYCRIRPFLPRQKDKQTIVEYVGDNGELIVMNPSKQGKEGRRSFKFNKVYGPSATQAQVFADIQPLIQSVLDGYNVCIFAYGQTGSGKTYTMTGPDGATEEQWGVNYRALNDLFQISQKRGSAFSYEITVQMVEIYNEQVRDLLSSDGSQKRLGILNTSQPNGLAVPDASMFPVNKPSDVLDLMNMGLKSRAKSSTSMNERSSRSHSIVTIHVRGMDKKSGSSMHSSLHLVDLAGSERVDRSEVTGDRLKEAQHINKSLAALGDVISALSTKSPHVPYRNSKLTQVLQSSLGGQAKTLMFVQLNPDHVSYSESISTLKFAERAYGVELGAAKSSKEGKDVRELMEQVASLKETIAAKDEEIEKLQQAKVVKV